MQAANTLVPLAEILNGEFGLDIPDSPDRSWKGYCPFQFEHPNPIDRNWRFYPSTNTAYCFEMHGLLTPVNLTVMSKDCTLKQAALSLLEPRNLLRPKPWRERWGQMMHERSAKDVIDTQGIMAALHVWIANQPNLAALQFTEPFQLILSTQLGVLDSMVETDSMDNIHFWYELTKNYLTALLMPPADPHNEAVDSTPVD